MNINQKELIKRISTETGMTKEATELFLKGLRNTLLDIMKAGDKTSIRGLASFEGKLVKEHVAFNPRNKTYVNVETHYSPQIRASKTAKEYIRN